MVMVENVMTYRLLDRQICEDFNVLRPYLTQKVNLYLCLHLFDSSMGRFVIKDQYQRHLGARKVFDILLGKEIRSS